MKAKLFLVVSIVLLITSCASAPGARFNKDIHLTLLGDDLTQVVVYRYKQYAGSADTTEIIDNDVSKGNIVNGGFIVYKTEPKAHRIHTKTAGIDKAVTIELEPNQTYYFRADFQPSWIGFWRLSAIHPQQALSELSNISSMQ